MHNQEFEISFRRESAFHEHMHQEIELLYVMDGEICLHLFEKTFRLESDDFLVINSNHRHSYSMEKPGSVCLIHFAMEMTFFHCNSTLEEDERYSYIRDLMSQLLSECAVDYTTLTFRKKSLLYDLLDYLTHHFQVKETERYFDEQDLRIEGMLQYINAHYRESLSLKELSEKFYMTPSSVSRYFKKATGSNYIQYVNQIRMHYALEDLCYTGSSVTSVALAHGFSNASGFCRLFREQYGTTPIEYRKRFQDNSQRGFGNDKEILKQLKKYEALKPVRTSNNYKTDLVSIECDAAQYFEWKNLWAKAFHLGTAYELLSAAARAQISMAKKEIGFTYGHVLSIFSEKMTLRHEHEKIITNYAYIDSVLDYLVEQKIHPVISLDNKKEVIMKDIRHYLYESKEEFPFKSMEEMLAVTEDFLRHVTGRYGTKEVSEWIFDCWYHHYKRTFMGLPVDNFSAVFTQVYAVIKSVIPGAKVGTWGLGITEQSQDSLIFEIMKQWSSSAIHPDYIGLLLYPYAVLKKEDLKLDYRRRTNNAQYYSRIVSTCRNMMNECGLQDVPIYVNEWNTSMSKRNYYNETCGKAAHLLQMISGLNAGVDYAAYKELTDLSGIYEDNRDYMFGGWGLVNAFGARKPVYYAFMFLSRLGNCLLYKDPQAIITYDQHETYTILCFNAKRLKYSYYTKTEDEIPANEIEKIFENDKKLEITFCLEHMENGEYSIRVYRVYPTGGSVLHEWIQLGMKESLEKEDHEYLKNISVPEKKLWHIRAVNEMLVFRQVLVANEIRLIRIKRK